MSRKQRFFSFPFFVKFPAAIAPQIIPWQLATGRVYSLRFMLASADELESHFEIMNPSVYLKIFSIQDSHALDLRAALDVAEPIRGQLF